MTRKTSWYPLEVSVSCDQPLSRIEDILKEQLPQIGDSIPEIISGPYYRGTVSISKGAVTLSIVAECNEGDYFTVQRSLIHAIQDLFEKHSITIM